MEGELPSDKLILKRGIQNSKGVEISKREGTKEDKIPKSSVF